MMMLHYGSLFDGAPIDDVKGLRAYALVLLKTNTSRCIEDIAALRWSDLQIQDRTVTIHWRHFHGLPRDEQLPSVVSVALLRYLQALHGTALAAVSPDMPLWVGLRRIRDQMMLSTRAIVAIYQEYASKDQSTVLQTRFVATPAERIMDEQFLLAERNAVSEQSKPRVSATHVPTSIDAIAAAALAASLRSLEFTRAVLAPDELVVLREELVRRKNVESKSATIRSLWHTSGGKRFIAASRLYTFVLHQPSGTGD